MHYRWRSVFWMVTCALTLGWAATSVAGIPDITQSFYVPQAGDPDPTGAPDGSSIISPMALTEGAAAIRLFRMCPNNDGGSSVPNNARLKVVVRDVNGAPVKGVPAADVCILLNGGTPAQGFSGVGADSVIANSQWNLTPLCPDIRCIAADAPTNGNGVTFITFTGGDPATPGIGTRNPNRKMGHYDTELPVYVFGFKLSGRLTTGAPNGTYTLRIKNMDWTGGLGAVNNQGETVTVADFNGIANGIAINNAISYWKDFDNLSGVTATDLNIITSHLGHDCDSPNNP